MARKTKPTSDRAVTRVTGKAVIIRGNDIDTDRIIPARFMKVVTFDGLGEHAFHDERFGSGGEKKIHPFDDPRNAGACILLVNRNFGCGSSREHAPQALMRWGIRAIVGESFAEIFAGNCNVLGIPAVTVGPAEMATLMRAVEQDHSSPVTVDVQRGRVSVGPAQVVCTMPESYRQPLVAGTWDSTAVLLSNTKLIAATAGRLPYVHAFE